MGKGTCKFEGCTGTAVGKGYCARHYKSWRRGALPKARYKTCTHESCRKPRHLGSKCEEHARKPSAETPAAAAATPSQTTE